MRLWHKDLIPVLPRQQLLGQWRECCLIAKSIAETGTPNHILVNRIMEYEPAHYYNYVGLVCDEMQRRGYKVKTATVQQWLDQITGGKHDWLCAREVFDGWHDDEYMRICYYNLKEKYLCGGISSPEWDTIEYFVEMGWGLDGN